MADAKICSVGDCGKPARARGYCKAHYKRWYRHGDPHAGGTEMGARLRWLEAHKDYGGSDCIEWPFPTLLSGYCHIHFNGKSTLASRVICRLAHGHPPDETYHAAHTCGNGSRGCLNPQHLRWATRQENENDKLAHGTRPRGERQGSAKLTREQVAEIRAMSGAVLQREIAERFGVARQHISKIVSGKLWAWLE